MAAIVEKDWKTVNELIRWWHNRPKQIVGSEIDFAMKWTWKAAIAAEALKPSHNSSQDGDIAMPKLPPFNEAMLAACPDELPGVVEGNPVLRGAKAMYEYLERQSAQCQHSFYAVQCANIVRCNKCGAEFLLISTG